MASVSKAIHTDNQLHTGQFGKTACAGWMKCHASDKTPFV
jgi:hypothetical protein